MLHLLLVLCKILAKFCLPETLGYEILVVEESVVSLHSIVNMELMTNEENETFVQFMRGLLNQFHLSHRNYLLNFVFIYSISKCKLPNKILCYKSSDCFAHHNCFDSNILQKLIRYRLHSTYYYYCCFKTGYTVFISDKQKLFAKQSSDSI